MANIQIPKIYIQNLGMIVTNKCNLNCGHCLRGCKNDQDMSQEVIEATLGQLIGIGNLCLCGGEPTLVPQTIESIFNNIIKNKIRIEEVSTTINGTNYSPRFLELLDYINDYMMHLTSNGSTAFFISYDHYHLQEIQRLKKQEEFVENVKKYAESKYFSGFRELDPNLKLFREGNATLLNPRLSVKLKPMDIVLTYIGKGGTFDRNGVCSIGPLITINTEGIITEDNASLEHQQTNYYYGNVLTDSIEEVALKRGKVLKPAKWDKETGKIIKKYTTYNH